MMLQLDQKSQSQDQQSLSDLQQKQQQSAIVEESQVIDIQNISYSTTQDYSTMKELKNYFKTSFLHCPNVTFRYSAETENLDFTTYLREIRNNIQCFENIIFIFKFTKSIEDYKRKHHKTIVGGNQKEFKIECNLKAKKMMLILDYQIQFTFIDEVMIQKFASQQSKMQNLDGIHLQRDLFEAIFLIKQLHYFNSLEFVIPRLFLPMNLYKVFEFWSNLRVLTITCQTSKITIDNLKKIMQIKLSNPERELIPSLYQILGEDISENYQKIVISDFPFKKEEIIGFKDIKNIIKMKIDLNFDFSFKSYSPTDLFRFFSTQTNLNSLYFRCLPYPASSRLNDEDFSSICSSVIKLKSLNHLYLDMNFSNLQITRINRIEFKINSKQAYLQLINLIRKKYPALHQMRQEIKFELINMFLTEKMRELKPTLDVSLKNKRKDPIALEIF